MISFEWYAKYFKEYLTLTLDTYSKYSPPVFCTYYNNNKEDFNEPARAGYTSPSSSLSGNRYTKILGVPLFFTEQATYPVTSHDPRGVVAEDSTLSVVMFAAHGIIPKPDDHLSFPIFSEYQISTTALYQVYNVEPVLALTSTPLIEKYQTYKLTLKLDDSLVSDIEAKVTNTLIYIDKFHKYLPVESGTTYFILADLCKQIETYLIRSKDSNTLCFTPIKLIDAIYVSNQLFASPITTSRLTENIPNLKITTSIVDGLCLLQPNYSPYVRKLEEVYTPSGDAFIGRRWWNRGCWITVEEATSATRNIHALLYETDGDTIHSLISTIIQKHISHNYSLLTDPHPLSTIFNLEAHWRTTNTLPNTLPTYTNWLEALYLYSVCKRILETIVI